jgi:polyhydroxybutyrate depolymerase
MPLLRKMALLAAAMLMAHPASAEEHLTIDGRDRTYSVFRSPGLGRDSAVPLVLVLHGGFGTGHQAEKSYRWDALAQAKGFVAVYPDGYRRSWNAGGGCCGPALRESVDDVKFLTSVIRAVSKSENIDQRRIFLTGISNGAAMSYRYACAGPIAVGAIGSVSGTMPGGCPSPKPVSVLEIHGLKDQNIPFAGGTGSKGVTKIDWPAVQKSLDAFRQAGRCGPAKTSVENVVTTSTNACARGTDVSLITISDAGHQWPGAEPNWPLARLLLDLDPPSRAIDATSVIWDFFQRHPAP